MKNVILSVNFAIDASGRTSGKPKIPFNETSHGVRDSTNYPSIRLTRTRDFPSRIPLQDRLWGFDAGLRQKPVRIKRGRTESTVVALYPHHGIDSRASSMLATDNALTRRPRLSYLFARVTAWMSDKIATTPSRAQPSSSSPSEINRPDRMTAIPAAGRGPALYSTMACAA